jgi:hypothetical protein
MSVLGYTASHRGQIPRFKEDQMTRKTRIASWLIAVTLILSFGTAHGRFIESWPYARLFKTADLVIIAKALSVCDAPEVDKATPLPREWDHLVAVVTTLKVEYVVKGDYKDDRLKLVHFRLKKGSLIINGPLLAKFSTKPQRFEGPRWSASFGQPDYMVFLKKTKDGHFECVSGQYDSELSVKQILSPLP